MSNKGNKNQEFLATCMWQRNLSQARNINVDLNNVLDDSFNVLLDLLNNFKVTNDTDRTGLLLSLFACVGHLCVESTVTITNHSTNLNIFLLLIGPSGCGKSKIISPLKKAMLNTVKSLGITNEKAGIFDEFTTASLTAKLAKSNVIIMTDEAEKPLLSMGFYSPLSETSAAERISGCKFFGTVPTTKDTMSYHLEITSHLSFVGATTGRMWHRLINYYARGHQSDGFSERFIHYAMPKKNDVTINTSESLDYDEDDDETNDNDDDISDEDYEFEKTSHTRRQSPSLSQILIVCQLVGKRQFILSRNGTKKFYNKVRQYQELSQLEKQNDVNFGSRMGKSAEIICKLAAISQIVKISIEILKELQEQDQLQYDNTNFIFIRNAAQIIETKYSSINNTLEIEASSCRLAGILFCNVLRKMFFALYNVEPVLESEKTPIIESMSLHSTTKQIRKIILNMPQLFFKKRDLTGPMGLLRHHATDMVNIVIDELIEYQLIRQGPFITNSPRSIIHMKSYPSHSILNDPVKRNIIDRIFGDVNMNLTTYMSILTGSIIKEKQTLTKTGKEILLQPEHNILYNSLKQKYPEHFIESSISNETNAEQNISNASSNHSRLTTENANTINIITGIEEPILCHQNQNLISNGSTTSNTNLHSISQTETLYSYEKLTNTTTNNLLNRNSNQIQDKIILGSISRIFSNNNIPNSQSLNNFSSTNNYGFPISPITSILSACHVTTAPIYQVPSTTKNYQPAIAQIFNEAIASTTTKTTNSVSKNVNILDNNPISHNLNGKSYSARQKRFSDLKII
ncbi:unnamed protein product [Rotaria sp. Silwood1]|nr:unnamed protein product [Rotaria sp. Silwood1]